MFQEVQDRLTPSALIPMHSPGEAITELDDPDLLKPPFDRSFKRPGGFLIKHKLEAAKTRAGTGGSSEAEEAAE